MNTMEELGPISAQHISPLIGSLCSGLPIELAKTLSDPHCVLSHSSFNPVSSPLLFHECQICIMVQRLSLSNPASSHFFLSQVFSPKSSNHLLALLTLPQYLLPRRHTGTDGYKRWLPPHVSLGK